MLNQNNKTKLLLTGANGLMGQNFLEYLIAKGGYEILATGKGPDRFKGKGYRYQTLDIADAEAVNTLADEFRPNAIVNPAAMTQVGDCDKNKEQAWAVNTKAVGYLAQAAAKHNSFLLHVSTDFVLDGQYEGFYTEDAPRKPVNYYGETKAAAEALLEASDCRWAIARTVVVYGLVKDMGRSNLVLWVKSSLEQGKKIRVVTDQKRTPTYVGDLSAGCEKIIAQSAEGIFHICGPVSLSPYQIAMKVAAFYGLDQTLILPALSADFDDGIRRPAFTSLSIEKARVQLGYSPKTLEENLPLLVFY